MYRIPSIFMIAVFIAVLGSFLCATGSETESMAKLYRGNKVTTRKELSPYTGKDAWKMVVGASRQKACKVNYDQLGINYGESVDFQLRQRQVILCPQTAEFLYTQFTPTKVRYQKGTRPALEKVVSQVTKGCQNDRQKVLALMRFCRDIYKKREGKAFPEYIYGGTEEQLIDKGEEFCECLGRLMVALCEVAGMPGRIVMHNIGGHIASEIHVDGNWAYIDPRAGIYFIKSDGSFASTWDLWQDPSILRRSSLKVKADASARWMWEERIWKCENMFFHHLEVNGLENYSLADADQYSYSQKTYKKASDDGLFVINKKYIRLINEVFGLAGDGFRHKWSRQKLRKVELAYRNDGFSQYFDFKPPMTRQQLEQRDVDPFHNTNTILVWGLGPGSVFCFDTKAGEICGSKLSDEEWKKVRLGDRRVYENVMGLIREGAGPLRIAVERSHQLGLKVFARTSMNHEYGPASLDNWKWLYLVGDFNKQHPEYRVSGSVNLDFKHKAVRDYKLAILRDAAEMGADGISLDFVVYPPHFTKPDCAIMTQFVRDVRSMLDEVGRKQNRRIELMTRVPCARAKKIGLDWKTWMRERIIDYIVPSLYKPFDIDVGEFVSMGNQTGVKVFPTIFQAVVGVGVCTDGVPGEEEKSLKRYTKPKTQGMYFAQAMMFHRAGVDGLQLGFASGIQWHKWYSDLTDPAKVEFADKHYAVNFSNCPIDFCANKGDLPASAEKSVPLRIGDNIPKAKREGHEVQGELIAYVNPMVDGQKLDFYVNDHGPVVIKGLTEKSKSGKEKTQDEWSWGKPRKFQKSWWKKGECRMPFPAEWLQMGNNEIRIVYTSDNVAAPVSVRWIDLTLKYRKADTSH